MKCFFILFWRRQVIIPANTGRKKGYCILGDWSCASISMIRIQPYFVKQIRIRPHFKIRPKQPAVYSSTERVPFFFLKPVLKIIQPKCQNYDQTQYNRIPYSHSPFIPIEKLYWNRKICYIYKQTTNMNI